MKKSILVFSFLWALMIGGISAQTLKFNANGKFKIVQFTDVHYIADGCCHRTNR